MILNDNKIDYIHWNDPNEIVDRQRLLEVSCQADHNNHNNEILSIIEEFREIDLIIINLVLHTSFSRNRNADQQIWTIA